MFKKEKSSMSPVCITALLVLFAGCSNLQGRLQGEWIVDPEKTVRLDANKDLVQGWENFQKRLLADTDLRFIFQEEVLTIFIHDKKIFRAKYKIMHVSDEEVIIQSVRNMRIVFESEDTAIIESGGKFDQYYVQR